MPTETVTRAQNHFEQYVGSIPEPIGSFLLALLSPFEEALEFVAGDPDDLVRAAEVWSNAAEQVRAVAEEQQYGRSVLGETWTGDGNAAFDSQLRQFEQAVEQLAGAAEGTSGVLVEAANAAVEAFNLIVELIIELLLWIVADLVAAAALAAFTFGASLAAGFAKALATGAVYLSRVLRVMDRFADVLRRVAALLTRVGGWANDYRRWILDLRRWQKDVGYASVGGQALATYRGLVRAPVLWPVNEVSPVDIPGLSQVGEDALDGIRDLEDGDLDGNYLLDEPPSR